MNMLSEHVMSVHFWCDSAWGQFNSHAHVDMLASQNRIKTSNHMYYATSFDIISHCIKAIVS
jgi:hypothetical protein